MPVKWAVLVLAVGLLGGACRTGAEFTEDTSSPMQRAEDEIAAIDSRVLGAWIADAADIPLPLVTALAEDEPVILEVIPGRTTGAASVAVEVGDECSEFGGPLVAIEPVEFSMTTIAGEGGSECTLPDAIASALLREMTGIESGSDEETLVVAFGDQQMSFTRLGG